MWFMQQKSVEHKVEDTPLFNPKDNDSQCSEELDTLDVE